MASKLGSYRFDEKTIDLINRIKSEGDFKSIDDAVAAALEFYEAENNEITAGVNQAANLVFDVSVKLERIRDHEPENFDEKASKGLDNLNEVWGLLRANPYYFETQSDRIKGLD